MIEFICFIGLTCFFLACLGGGKSSSRRGSGGATIHFCNDGMEGHERRVAEFYGDDYDEILTERKKLWAYRDDMTKEKTHVTINGKKFKVTKLTKEDIQEY